MLVCVETLLKILNQKIAVAQGSPGRTVLWVYGCQLEIVLNGMMVLTVGGTILSKLIQVRHIHESVTVVTSLGAI